MPESPLTEAAAELAKEVAKKEGKDSKRPLWILVLIGISPALATGYFSYRTSKVEAEARTKQQEAELHLSVDATYATLATSVNNLAEAVKQNTEDLKNWSQNTARMQGQLEELERLSFYKGRIKSSIKTSMPEVIAGGGAETATGTFSRALPTGSKFKSPVTLPTNADVVIKAYQESQKEEPSAN